MWNRFLSLAAAALSLAGCADQDVAGTLMGTKSAETSFALGASEPGAVYVMTNAAAGNEIVRYRRSADGSLSDPSTYSTGGTGAGAGLGSQGAVTLSDNGQWLLAVNALSNDVSVFRVQPNGLALTDRAASGGSRPISVTVHGNLVYVLNAGGSGNISGLVLSPSGKLSALAGSTQPLSGPAANPAQISFTPDGDWLVVTEKATNQILTYAVPANGVAGASSVYASAGTTPFGFAFAGRDRLVVSEAFGGAPDGSAASSYVLASGSPIPVSSSVPTTETAACWAVATANGRFVYVSNAGSASLSGYAVGNDGTLAILNADGKTGTTNGNPLDAATSVNSQYLYTVNGNGTISAFEVAADGSLTAIAGANGLPRGAVGIAAR